MWGSLCEDHILCQRSSARESNFGFSAPIRERKFALSACRNTELNFELCCVVRVSAFPKFGECCVAKVLSTHSILSALYFSSPSTTSAVLRWLVMLVLSNLYRCMFIEFYFLSKFSNSIKRLTHKRNGAGCPSAASLSSSFARQILSILFLCCA